MNRPKVLHILGSTGPEATGIANVVRSLLLNLDQRRYEGHVMFLGDDGPLAIEFKKVGIPVRALGWWRGARDPVGAWRFLRAVRREKFAILHQHAGGGIIGCLTRRATTAGMVVQLWSRIVEPRCLTPRVIRIRDADAVIATSRALFEVIVGAKPLLVYPGVDVPEAGGHASAAIRHSTIVGTASRLVPIKGIPYLIRAISELQEDFPNLQLEIAGSGPEEPKLRSLVDSLGLNRRVRFLGWQPDISRVLQTWDVFALASLEENFPLAGLEAMAAGLPVVATAVGGIPELVEDGTTGWVVPPHDSPALAERIQRLLARPEQRRRMGENGRLRVCRNFTVERMVRQVSALYDELLSSSPCERLRKNQAFPAEHLQ